MKKLLLGTTALIGAVAISTSAIAGGAAHSSKAASAAAGSNLNVTVGGFIDFQAGFADQDSAFETGANSREYKFQNDTEVHVNVSGQSDNGLKYGAVIELEADISNASSNEGVNADKTYIFVESKGGRVELGGNTGAENTLKVDAASIARATGGVDGDFYDFANLSGATFIIRPDLPSSHALGVSDDATKITYYTPSFNGAQVGISYTPDNGDAGSAAGFTGELNGDQENIFGLGLNYARDVDGVGVTASVTGEFGDAELAGTEDTSAWALGLGLDYQGYSLAGSWADWGESGLATGSINDDQQVWTLGAAYETGPFGVSLTYLDSESQDREFTNLVLGADYALAPGLVPYVEVSFFETDDNNIATTDNDGSVVLIGAELNF